MFSIRITFPLFVLSLTMPLPYTVSARHCLLFLFLPVTVSIFSLSLPVNGFAFPFSLPVTVLLPRFHSIHCFLASSHDHFANLLIISSGSSVFSLSPPVTVLIENGTFLTSPTKQDLICCTNIYLIIDPFLPLPPPPSLGCYKSQCR